MLTSLPLWGRPEDVVELDICQKIEAQKNSREGSFKEDLKLIWRALGLFIAPRFFSIPDFQGQKALQVFQKEQDSKSDSINLIFGLGPLITELNGPIIEEERNRYNVLTDEIKHQSIKYLKINLARNLKSCYRKLKKYNFDYQKYLKNLEERESLFLAKRSHEQEELTQNVRRKLKHSRLAWKMIPYSNTPELLEAIRGKYKGENVENIIFVNHALSSGQLKDSTGQVLPLSLFKQLSPGIKSLSFFSCFSDKIGDLYQIKNSLMELPSFFEERFLITVKERIKESYKNLAPIKGFRAFFKKVDRFLYKKQKQSDETNNDERSFYMAKMCKLNFPTSLVKKGELNVFLNGNYIAEIDKSPRGEITFNCSFLKDEDNMLLFRAKDIENPVELQTENFEDFLNPNFLLSSKKIYYLSGSKNLRSLKMKFDLIENRNIFTK